MTTRTHIVPDSIQPHPFETEYAYGINYPLDRTISEQFSNLHPSLEILNPQICNEAALRRLASILGVNAPFSILYGEDHLPLTQRRELVSKAYILNQRGTYAALDTFAEITNTTYTIQEFRNSQTQRLEGIHVTVYISALDNIESWRNYLTRAYTELLGFYHFRQVFISIILPPGSVYHILSAVGSSEYTSTIGSDFI